MKKKFVLAFVTCFMAMGMTAFAAEPAAESENASKDQAVEAVVDSSDDVIVIDITDDGIQLADEQDVDDNEVVIVNADDETGIMPLSAVRGYECIHASGSSGTKYITASGGSSSSGYMQVAVREYTGNPEVNVVLYRPDGSYAGQLYLHASDGTKSIRFNTANSGTYKVVWGLGSGYTCDIDVWISW